MQAKSKFACFNGLYPIMLEVERFRAEPIYALALDGWISNK